MNSSLILTLTMTCCLTTFVCGKPPLQSRPAPVEVRAAIPAFVPGLVVTEYPRHDLQANDDDSFYLPLEKLGQPVGTKFVVESLAPWTWTTERNATASGLLEIPADGDYAFTTRSFYDRNLLMIEGEVVCGFADGDETVKTISLKKGRVSILSAGFVGGRGASGITVRWKPPGQVELSPIPAKHLLHEDDGSVPPPSVPQVEITNPKKLIPAPAKPKPAPPQPPNASLNPTRWPVQILYAMFGSGDRNADVTQRVKEFVETKQTGFYVNPTTLGIDPIPYWKKSLWMAYMKDGVRREVRRYENEFVLTESFYGPQDAKELDKWLPATRWLAEKGELQFHADHTATGYGFGGTPKWEAISATKIRIAWSAENTPVYVFDSTWSSFHAEKDTKEVFRVMQAPAPTIDTSTLKSPE